LIWVFYTGYGVACWFIANVAEQRYEEGMFDATGTMEHYGVPRDVQAALIAEYRKLHPQGKRCNHGDVPDEVILRLNE
jgi:hypothetical protein